MRWLFDPRRPDALRAFRRNDTLVALDFEGSLASLVGGTAIDRVSSLTSQRLARLAARYRVAIVTTRDRSQVADLFDGFSLFAIVGLEDTGPDEVQASVEPDVIESWRSELEERLEGLAGVCVRREGQSLAVYYHSSPHWQRAARAVRQVTCMLEGARLIEGKRQVHLVAAGRPLKGEALALLRRRLKYPPTLYVSREIGDGSFNAYKGPGVLCIGEGSNPKFLAPYILKEQVEVDRFLMALMVDEPGAASSISTEGS